MALGLVFAFVLIQGQLAPLLSDTFFVPGYFHFFTLGTVSMTLLAALSVVLPALGGRALWRPEILRWMPWLALLGLLVFGAAGISRRLPGRSTPGDGRFLPTTSAPPFGIP
jgi:cytochrome c oxidase subunit 1